MKREGGTKSVVTNEYGPESGVDLVERCIFLFQLEYNVVRGIGMGGVHIDTLVLVQWVGCLMVPQ